jgi:cytochrome bd-type quinol oxidase subunit 2
MGLGGLILAFIYCWYFTLISIAYMPLIMMVFAIFGKKLKEA